MHYYRSIVRSIYTDGAGSDAAWPRHTWDGILPDRRRPIPAPRELGNQPQLGRRRDLRMVAVSVLAVSRFTALQFHCFGTTLVLFRFPLSVLPF